LLFYFSRQIIYYFYSSKQREIKILVMVSLWHRYIATDTLDDIHSSVRSVRLRPKRLFRFGVDWDRISSLSSEGVIDS